MVYRSDILHSTYFEQTYQQRLPALTLRPLILGYAYASGFRHPSERVCEALLPDLSVRLSLSLNAGLQTHPEAPLQSCGLSSGQYLQRWIHPHRHTQLVLITQPGAWPLLQAHLSGPRLQQLHRELKALPDQSAEAYAACLDTYFLQHLPAQTRNQLPTGLAVVQQALQRWQSKPTLRLSELSAQLGHSPRTLERYFQSNLQLTPKQCQRLLRFRQSLSAYLQRDRATKYHSSLDAYSDASHFYKEFRFFARTGLRAFLQQHR